MDYDDLPVVTALCDALALDTAIRWRHLDDTMSKLQSDSGYLLNLTLPHNKIRSDTVTIFLFLISRILDSSDELSSVPTWFNYVWVPTR